MLRGMARWAALVLLLAGCGGPTSGAEGGGGEGSSGGEDAAACGPRATRLGATCWRAVGTHWRIDAEGPGGQYRFEVELLAAGRVRSTDHDAASAAHDEWFQDGSLLRIFLSDRFVEYRTRVTNGTVLIGEAINVRGQRWSWRGDRVFGETPCEEGEVRVDGACMSLAGTRWDLSGQVVEFLDGGRVAVGASEDATGRWEQSGTALRFTLGEGRPAHLAELTDSAELRGTIEGPGASWSAARLVSIPPIMHE